MALLKGTVGNDTLVGTADADTIVGDAGNDIASGGAGNDVVLGNQGNDTLTGNQGNDTFWGGQGNDALWGGGANDLIFGGEGSDSALWGHPISEYGFAYNVDTNELFVTHFLFDGATLTYGPDGTDIIEGDVETLVFAGVAYSFGQFAVIPPFPPPAPPNGDWHLN